MKALVKRVNVGIIYMFVARFGWRVDATLCAGDKIQEYMVFNPTKT